ncbi:APC family permease [Homoserinimonas sp. OAct 916]|uniref:APC family permease n=1 Tax=Homoserinimonas sp. OAct 916 TaxID=2211450 RepID=UPI000DBE2801|nr:APC family permease [Homoserinimonas sp. OAct 916]
MSATVNEGSETQAGPGTGLGTADRAGVRKLGVPGVTFMIIAASAPLTVVAGGVTTNFAVSGVVAVPLSFIVLGGLLAVFAVGYAAMSRYIRNAGAFYAYIAQGIGRPVGVGSSILALMSYNAMQIGIYGLFGFALSSLVFSLFGVAIPWWIYVLVCIVVVGLFGVTRINLSARILAVFVALEFIVVIIYDFIAFMVAPEGVDAVALDPANFFVPGIGAVFVFGIAAFMGFESAAIYSEESKDPKRTVARATFTAVAIMGIFYAFSAWAMTIGTGPSQIIDVAREQGPDLMFIFLETQLGAVFADLAQVLFVTSLFAALVSFHNAVARYFFSLGREGVIFRPLATVRRNAPIAGSMAQSVLAAVVIIVFAISGAGSELGELFPVLTLFSWLTNAGAMGLVLMMTIVSLAVIGYFRSNRRGYGAWTTVIAPVIAFAGLGLTLVLILINFHVLLDQPTIEGTTFILPAIIIVPGLLGVVWAYVLKSRNPGVYQNIGRGGDDPDALLDAPDSADEMR